MFITTRGLVLGLLSALVSLSTTHSQVVLSGSSYTENFNNLSEGLPLGWSLYSGATADSLQNLELFDSTPTTWSHTAGRFKNFASANNSGVSSGDSGAIQNGYSDRALGIRQTSSFGDPGAAFVLSLEGTEGFSSFGLTLDLQMLSVQSRSTTWTLDYRIGSSGNFVSLGTYEDPGAFGSTTETFSFGSALDGLSDPVFIRVAALDDAFGSGSRDSFGIDNVSLSYTPVPEPEEYALVMGLVLAGYAAIRRKQLNSAPAASTGD